MSIFSSKPQPITAGVLRSLGLSPVISFAVPFPENDTIWIKEIGGSDLGDNNDPNIYGDIIYYPKHYKGTDGIILGAREISFAGRCKITLTKNICKEFISDPLDTNIQLALWIQTTLKRFYDSIKRS